MNLEQGLDNQKQRISNQLQDQLVELPKNFNAPKIQHDPDLKVLDAQIQELEQNIENLKVNPELVEFKGEERELYTLLLNNK